MDPSSNHGGELKREFESFGHVGLFGLDESMRGTRFRVDEVAVEIKDFVFRCCKNTTYTGHTRLCDVFSRAQIKS